MRSRKLKIPSVGKYYILKNSLRAKEKTMTFHSTDKMKLSVLVVAFLLLVSAFTFLPAVGAFSSPTVAKTGAAPATVTGATATIDYPILAGYSASVTRTISLANPIGNTPISRFTISIPKGAASVAPTGAVYAGSPGATVAVYGTGPWAIVYTGPGFTSCPSSRRSDCSLTVTFTTETTFASTSGVLNPYKFRQRSLILLAHQQLLLQLLSSKQLPPQ